MPPEASPIANVGATPGDGAASVALDIGACHQCRYDSPSTNPNARGITAGRAAVGGLERAGDSVREVSINAAERWMAIHLASWRRQEGTAFRVRLSRSTASRPRGPAADRSVRRRRCVSLSPTSRPRGHRRGWLSGLPRREDPRVPRVRREGRRERLRRGRGASCFMRRTSSPSPMRSRSMTKPHSGRHRRAARQARRCVRGDRRRE